MAKAAAGRQPQPKELVMQAKILVPIDDSETARRTIGTIIELRQHFARQLTLLHVINQEQLAYRMIPDFQLDMVRENATRAGKALLAQTDARLQAVGFSCEQLLEFGDPRQTISRIANEQGFQLLVIGRHEGGGGLRDVLFGSVANHVLHNVRCPVLLL
jgi:nucleotide-binding universal stress UspA family protein